ncbi:MAG: PKD-like domain-containing protein, partial [bacterium]
VPTYSASLSGGESAENQSFISGLLYNQTSTNQFAYYTVTPSTNNCDVSNAFTVTVEVRAGGYIDPMSTVICSGVRFSVVPENGTNGIVPDGITYSWGVPALSASISGAQSNSGQSEIFGTLVNNTNTIQTATYNVVPTPLNCGSNSSFTLTVSILPAAYINNLILPVCNGVPFEFTPVDGLVYGIVPENTRYTWMPPNTTASISGGNSGTNRTNFSGQLYNSSNTIQTATYIVATKTGSCDGLTFTVQITLNPPVIITPMSTVVCSGSTFNVLPQQGTNGTVPDNTLYSWDEPNYNGPLSGGQSGSNLKPITGRLSNLTNTLQSATYSIRTISGSCIGAPFTLTVFVNPTPVFSAMSTVVCSGVTFEVSPRDGFIGNIVPADTRYRWSEPSYSASMTGGVSDSNKEFISGRLFNLTNVTRTATYIVTPRAITGSCEGNPFTLTVFVNPTPVFSAMSTVVCSGVTFEVSPRDGFIGNIVPADTRYRWSEPSYSASMTGGVSDSNKEFISCRLFNFKN